MSNPHTLSNPSSSNVEPIVLEEKNRYYAFVNLALFLSFLTSVEIVIIFIPVAKWIIMTALVLLSIVKFFLVILWFMHLIYDKAILFMIFLAGLLIATGTIIALLYLFQPQDMDRKAFSTWNVYPVSKNSLWS